MVKAIITSIFTLASILVFCQDKIEFEQVHSLVGEQIGQNSIHDIVQDTFGFMWFACQSGVYQYDGIEFTEYSGAQRDERFIKGGAVRDLFLDSNNAIWVTSQKGISRISFDKERHIFVTDTSVYSDFNTIDPGSFEFYDSLVVFQLNDSLVLSKGDSSITERVEKFAVAGERIFLADRNILKILYFHNLTIHSLVTFNSQIKFLKYDQPTSRLFISTQDTIWTLRNGQDPEYLVSLDKICTNQPKYLDIEITDIVSDKKGNLWIGTLNTGLYIWDPNSNCLSNYTRNLKEQFCLSSNLILSIYESRDGVVWIGTNGGGINKWAEKKQRFYHAFHDFAMPDSSKPFNNDVWAIYENTLKNQVWVGTDGQGIAVISLDSLEISQWIRNETDSLSKSVNTIRTIDTFISKDILLLGTDEGVYLYDQKTNYYDNKYLEVNNVRDVYISRDSIVVASYTDGIITISKENPIITEESCSLNVPSNCIYPYGNHSYLIGTDKGLYDNIGNHLASGEEFIVKCIIQIDDNKFWLGTQGRGLVEYYLDKDSIAFNKFIMNSVIYGIILDKSGRFWMSSNDGIFSIDGADGYAACQYKIQSGLQSPEFNTGAYALGDSLVYFGGINGLNLFYPKATISNINTIHPTDNWLKYYNDIHSSQYYKFEPTKILNFSINDNQTFSYCILNIDYSQDNEFYSLNSRIVNYEDIDYLSFKGRTKSIIVKKFNFPDWISIGAINIRKNIPKLYYLIAFLILTFSASGFALLQNIKQKRNIIDINRKLAIENTKNEELNTLLSHNIENQKTLIDLMNEVTSLNTCEEVIEKAKKTLVKNDLFKSEFCFFWQIDIDKMRIKDLPTPILKNNLQTNLGKERNLNNLKLEHDDILQKLATNKESILQVRVHPSDPKNYQIRIYGNETLKFKLDSEVLDKENHYLYERLFIPLYKPQKPIKYIQEENPLFGVFEIGKIDPRNKDFSYSEEDVYTIKEYLDNVAQVYHRLLSIESRDRHLDLIFDIHTEEHPLAYLQNFLRNLCNQYDCFGAEIKEFELRNSTLGSIKTNKKIASFFVDSKSEALTKEYFLDTTVSDLIGSTIDLDFESKDAQQYYNRYAYLNEFKSKANSKLDKIGSIFSCTLTYFSFPIGLLTLFSSSRNNFSELKATNISFLARRATSQYLRKKLSHTISSLVLPFNIYLGENKIYEQVLEILSEYFKTDDIVIWRIDQKRPNSICYECAHDRNRVGISIDRINIDLNVKIPILHQRTSATFKIFSRALKLDDSYKCFILYAIKANSENYGLIQIFSKRELFELYIEDEILLKQLSSKIEASIKSSESYKFFSDISQIYSETTLEGFCSEIMLFFRDYLNINRSLIYFNNSELQIDSAFSLRNALQPIEGNTLEILKKVLEEDIRSLNSGIQIHQQHTESSIFLLERNVFNQQSSKAIQLNMINSQIFYGSIFLYIDGSFDGNKSFSDQLTTLSSLLSNAARSFFVDKENKLMLKQNLARTQDLLVVELIGLYKHAWTTQVALIDNYSAIMSNALSKGDYKSLERNLLAIRNPIDKLKLRNRLLIDLIKGRTKQIESTSISTSILFKELREIVTAKIQKLSLNFISKGSEITFMSDPQILKNVLLNLTLNSIEASSRRSTIIFNSEIIKSKNKSEIRISIIDHGSGISEDIKDKIWLRSFTSKKEGTGLGLPASKQMVSLLEDTSIELTNKRNPTIFTLKIIDR